MSGFVYRMTDQADEVFRDHMDRLASKWGSPDDGLKLLPPYDLNDGDEDVHYQIASKADGRRFAALVRDARHYLEVHPHFGDDEPKADARVKRELNRIEDAAVLDNGKPADMRKVERWFRRARRNQAHPLAALAVIAAAVALFVWVVRSCS